MCSTNQITLSSTGRCLKSLSTSATMFVLAILCSLPATRASAQCTRCPSHAQATAMATGFSIFVNRGGQTINVAGDMVGACETLMLVANVAYSPIGIDPSGNVVTGAGFVGGNGHISGGSIVGATDVTPADM